MNLPWWVWTLGLVVIGIVIFVGSWRHYRTNIRKNFLAYLEQEHPELQIGEVTSTSVAYLQSEQLSDLAIENLGQSFRPEAIRPVLDESAMGVVKSEDTYDAARLSLIPGALQDGEPMPHWPTPQEVEVPTL